MLPYAGGAVRTRTDDHVHPYSVLVCARCLTARLLFRVQRHTEARNERTGQTHCVSAASLRDHFKYTVWRQRFVKESFIGCVSLQRFRRSRRLGGLLHPEHVSPPKPRTSRQRDEKSEAADQEDQFRSFVLLTCWGWGWGRGGRGRCGKHASDVRSAVVEEEECVDGLPGESLRSVDTTTFCTVVEPTKHCSRRRRGENSQKKTHNYILRMNEIGYKAQGSGPLYYLTQPPSPPFGNV